MGYYTTFDGCFQIDPPLKPEHFTYLRKFYEMPHYRYHVEELTKIPDFVREAVELPIGTDGEFSIVVGEPDDHWTANGIRVDPPRIANRPGLRIDDGVRVISRPPDTMPQEAIHCPWNVSEEGTEFHIGNGDGDSTKAYGFSGWLQYCVKNFFHRWGYTLRGVVVWRGDDADDFGKVVIQNNQITVYDGVQDYVARDTWGPDNEET